MNISRCFLLIGSVYLLVGIILGMYMGGSGDHSLFPLHAHINLLGFVLAAVFAVVYRIFPAMVEGRLALIHFWLHQIGILILLILLFLLLSGRIDESSMVPFAPISELFILIGIMLFTYNAYKKAF